METKPVVVPAAVHAATTRRESDAPLTPAEAPPPAPPPSSSLTARETENYTQSFASSFETESAKVPVDEKFKKALSRATGNGHALELAHAVHGIVLTKRKATVKDFLNACALLKDP